MFESGYGEHAVMEVSAGGVHGGTFTTSVVGPIAGHPYWSKPVGLL